ncbi:MAG: DUF1616 domain-containing protein [Thermoplasmata archaeon]
MVGANLPEVIAGALLVFFLPGYTVTRALFPEWRLRGPGAYLRWLETVALALVTSVVLTVLVGYVLLAAAPGGFQAYWTDPVLEVSLSGVALVAFTAGWVRGAYRREPPPSPAVAEESGEEGAWELTRELERLGREERRLAHALRTSKGPGDEERLRDELARVRAERDHLRERREAEYAS